MKSIKIKYLLGLLVAFQFVGCDNDFDELNTNPNVVTADQVPANNLFLATTEDISRDITDVTMMIISDMRGNAFPSGVAAYEEGTSEVWEEMYEQVKNVNELISLSEVGGREEHAANHAVARILKVIIYQRLVDLFGAVPYNEGGQGLEFPQPRFDSGDMIYADLISELDQAMATLALDPRPVYGSGFDYIYGNDGSQWAKFANSLKLRLAMRMRFADPGAAGAAITESLAGPLLESNDDSWAFHYPGSENSNSSSLYSTARPTTTLVSELLASRLRDTNDPRLLVFADAAGTFQNIYQGQVNGLDSRFDDGADSNVGEFMWNDPTFPHYLMTFAEVSLLKAEAALMGIGTGGANTEYQNAITASMQQWAVDDADIASYLGTPEATLSGTEEEQLEQIAMQKWVALFTNGHEGYAEMRRTGYPVIETRSATGTIVRLNPEGVETTENVGYRLGITEGVFPRRVEYPSEEKDLNPENVNAAIQAHGGGLLDKIWWDVR